MKGWLIWLMFPIAGVACADDAVYLMRGPVLPVSRTANGYVVEVRERGPETVEVRVETTLDPIGSVGGFQRISEKTQSAVPEGFELPAGLRAALHSDMDAWEAATTVLEWVSDHLELVDDDTKPQDASSILSQGGGRCSGLANASAALLMAAGFEARTVSGLLIDGRRAIPHRWVECRLPGAGWVPTDPTLGLWTVTAGHVAFGDTVDLVPAIDVVTPARGELDGLPRRGSVIVRPNLGAELICRLGEAANGRTAVASLQRGSDSRRAVLGKEVRFASLLPGRWVLTVEVEGRVIERRRLNLEAGAVHSYVVRLPFEEPEEVGS